MTWFDQLTIAVPVLYFIGAVAYLSGVIARRDNVRRLAMGCTLAGFGLHTLIIAANLLGAGTSGLQHGAFYIRLLAWSLVCIYLVVGWRLRLQFLALTASPLALVLYSWSLTVNAPNLPVPPILSTLWFGMHIGSLFLSISLLGLAFGAGAAYLYLERKIKTKTKLAGWNQDLPSLSSFDKANHFAVTWGFPLYTLGMLSGFIWAKPVFKQVFSWDPKEVATIFIWFLFAYLFHQRVIIGWRGRKPAKLAIWVFALTLISLVGINFFLPTHHSFRP